MISKIYSRPTFRSLLLLSLLSPLTLSAQGGGSSYSIFNIGDLETTTTGAGAGRAGVETAVPYTGLINSLNPAAWTSLNYVTIQAGLRFEQYRVSDADQSIWQNKTAFRNVAVGLPFSKKLGGAIALGIRPYSSVNYNTGVKQDVPSGDSLVPAELNYNGSGGVSQGFAGLALSPIKELSVGGTVDLYFGSTLNRTIVNFPTSSLNNAGYVNTDSWSGIGGSIGILANPTESLLIGATFSPGFKLNVEREAISIFQEDGIDDTVSATTTESSIPVPSRITVGASWKNGRTVLSGDLLTQGWGGNDSLSRTRNRLRTGIGVDYIPSKNPNASGLDTWTLRTGVWYEQTYYSLTQGDINEMGVALGVNIPFSSTGRLGSGAGADIGLEFGMRGTTDNGLTREMFGKLSLELAISEFWFVQ
ncbi:MAG: hypothetical protein KDD67_14345 [Ignavibacteriae bacterium]|nr:hypothetical protein [Ignavibacteriota bacterium]